jgi:hypothetical protein
VHPTEAAATRSPRLVRGDFSEGASLEETRLRNRIIRRAVHIHFKLRPASASGRNYEFTSQLYFDDSISEDVFAREPYTAKGLSALKNARDRIYRYGGSSCCWRSRSQARATPEPSTSVFRHEDIPRIRRLRGVRGQCVRRCQLKNCRL